MTVNIKRFLCKILFKQFERQTIFSSLNVLNRIEFSQENTKIQTKIQTIQQITKFFPSFFIHNLIDN